MRKSFRILALGVLLVSGLAAVPALYAQESNDDKGSTMGSGMMGQGDMMGMMKMMGQMSQMMETCNKMMQSMTDEDGSAKPNEQFRSEPPATPNKDG